MQAGTRLEQYEILDKLGEGGMGAVYRAEDTRLKRPVAIKVLPPELAQDEERLARLEREAQLLAALNHPNVATVHGFGDVEVTGEHAAERVTFLVMELVEGESLYDRIASGPLPWREAVDTAIGIAAGLEAAHERGIVHRDLKPANVHLAEDGAVKVLDFGLAKAFEAEGQSGSLELSASPTVAAATRTGVILGTAAYMSPEQARGKSVDKRADIWALGCVLYEMLAGQKAFDGETVSDVLASILKEEADLDALPAIPERLRFVLERCLAKDPARRLRDVGDVRLELEAARGEKARATGMPAAAGPAAWKLALPLAAVAAVLGLGVGYFLQRTPPPLQEARAILSIDGISVGPRAISISPDGRRIAENGAAAIRVRAMNDLAWRDLAETRGAQGIVFDQDGQRLYFTRAPQGGEATLHSVGVDGSSPILEATLGPGFAIPFRGQDGHIHTTLLGQNMTIARLETDGSLTQLFEMPGGDLGAFAMDELGPGRWLLWTVESGSPRGLGVVGVGDEAIVEFMEGYRTPKHLGGGRVLAVDSNGRLVSARIDAETGAVLEAPVILVEGLALASGVAGAFDLSSDGTLVYLAGPTGSSEQTLAWLHVDGRVEPITDREGTYQVDSRVSPDGRSLALELAEGTDVEVWIHDLERDVRSVLAPGVGASFPIWAPDGLHVAYRVNDGPEQHGIYRTPVDRSSPPILLLADPEEAFALPMDWSPDGGTIVYTHSATPTRAQGVGGNDIWLLPADGAEPVEFFATPANETDARFSPDGGWLAYQSDQTGSYEVYLRPVTGGGEYRVSAEGGTSPEWRADGSQLFFQRGGTIMVVDVDLGGSAPQFSAERVLVEFPSATRRGLWSPAPEGDRLLIAVAGDPTEQARLHAIFNWSFLTR